MDLFGAELSPLGDVDGDGVRDWIGGTAYGDRNRGYIQVRSGKFRSAEEARASAEADFLLDSLADLAALLL